MSNGVLDQVLEHALHERDVAAHEREIGTDACFQRNAALLRAKLKLLHDILDELRNRERLDFDRRHLRVELGEFEQLVDEFAEAFAVSAGDLDESALLVGGELPFL